MTSSQIDILPKELETEFSEAWDGGVKVKDETDFPTSRKENNSSWYNQQEEKTSQDKSSRFQPLGRKISQDLANGGLSGLSVVLAQL